MNGILPKVNTFFKDHLPQAMLWMRIVLAVMVVILAACLIFPKLTTLPIIVAEMLILVVEILFFSGFMGNMGKDDPKKKKYQFILKLALGVAVVFLGNTPIGFISAHTKARVPVQLQLMLNVIFVVLAVVLVRGDKVKEIIETLEKGITGISGVKEVKPGDIVLCDIKDEVLAGAKDPREILPAKDRFLHMLILGPTGCGKTSQIILPMVRQDIQNPNWGVTVLEPKGDLAVKAFMMAKHYGREAVYFDPSYKNCPKFNPLAGREVDVVENMATTFRMLNPDSPQFFLDLNEQTIRNAVKVLKRLDKAERTEGKYATFINLSRLLQNSASQGREIVNKFSAIHSKTDTEAKENVDIASWFLNDYFPERSKVYENTSGIRSQIAKLVSNEYLREVLNPDYDKGERNEVNFDKHLMEGTVICISTAQGTLRDLSRYLGYFIILSLQSAVFRRPGTEDTRRPHSLYIDEFQTYSTPGFSDMLTQGRSYRVSSILATQARAQMAMGGGKDGKNFVELVSSNARNIILFPGINKDDAKYYSDQFGEYEKVSETVTMSKKTFNPLMGGFDKLGYPSESIREDRKMAANFSVTDLIFGNSVGSSFGEIVYCIIKNNSVQPARVGRISYIPKDLNDKLNVEIQEYMDKYSRETAVDYAMNEEKEAEQDQAAEDELVFGDNGLDLEDLADDSDNIHLEVADADPLPQLQPQPTPMSALDEVEISMPQPTTDWNSAPSVDDLFS